jgi:SAM-dependent methyltransferase
MGQDIPDLPYSMPDLSRYRIAGIKTIFKRGKNIIKRQFLRATQIYFDIAGSNVECNICHYKANKLSSNRWHLHSNCPCCGSSVRSRLLYAALTNLDNFNEKKLIVGKNVLHFAPEDEIRDLLQRKAKTYKTADYRAQGYYYRDIDYNLDISDMNQVKDESFDCVIACDVLEHVYNFNNGIKEAYRVLTNGGYCIFTVPQKDYLAKTHEDITITDRKERERLFGQGDHFRIFGDDFVDVLQASGFEVDAIDENYFDRSIANRYVLAPPVLSQHPLATNFRKVFFGRKV